ncbi:MULTISPECIES: caspase family protein [unclassified Streptomyces]|uniref:caspase family protein n=1 Tax=unclassified Streptomyces TaxID=2593676 RepID=UPI0036F54354
MTDPAASRRYLLTTAVRSYPYEPAWDRPELGDDVQRVIDLFTRDLGYVHLPVLGLDPAKDQLLGRLREFCTSPERTADDYVAVYFAGHGEVREATNEHILLTADTRPADLSFTALRTEELARVLVEETPLRRVLLMLDTCESGSGGAQAAARAAVTDPSWRDAATERGFVVIASTQPYQLAIPGAFTKGLVRAVHSVATAGAMPASLQIDAVVATMQAQGGMAQSQQVVWDAVRVTGALPAFFPNPRAGATRDEIDLLLTRQARQQGLRAHEFSRELLPKAKASFDDGQWHFEGRHEALRAITSWLADPSTEEAGMAVTGAPGSGKSALLGLVCALTDGRRRRSVPVHEMGLPKGAQPREGAVHSAIYARGATVADVLAGIAAAAGTTAGTVGALVEHLRRWPEPVVVVVDALDEAVDPERLITSVLKPLLEDSGSTRLRLLLGTRRDLLPLLPASITLVDLDSAAYCDPAALRAHVGAALRAGRADNPFRTAPAAYVEAVAEAVAAAAGHSFLVARLIARNLVTASVLPDPSDPVWRTNLPRLPGDAMRRDLRQRFGDDLERAYDLLAALAHAEGQGLPWENLWAALASRIGHTHYEDEDVIRLRRGASSYVVEDTLEGHSVYRLYHQALTEHVRELRPATGELHAAFAEVLEATAPRRADGGADWERAHPYVRHHFATHAARGGVLARHLTDPNLLVAADPERMRSALRGTGGPEAAAYREYSTGRTGRSPGERLAYLLMAARRAGATALAEATEGAGRWPGRELPWQVPWSHWPSVQRIDHVLTHSSAPKCLAAPGSGELLTLDAAGLVRSWDLVTEVPRIVDSVSTLRRTVLHAEVDGAALVAGWEGSRVVARHVGSGRLVAEGPAFPVGKPSDRGQRGPVAVLATDDGRYVATAYFRRSMHRYGPHSSYRVGVRFTSRDGTSTWSDTTAVKKVRGLAGLEILQEGSGQVLVVMADTSIMDRKYTRIDRPYLRVWRPGLGVTDFADPRSLGTRPLVCTSTSCAVGRIDGDVLLALGTSDGAVHFWRWRPEGKQPTNTWTVSSEGGAPVTAMAFGSLRADPVLLFSSGGTVSVLSLEKTSYSSGLLHIGARPVTALRVIGGDQVAVASEDGQVFICDTSTAEAPPPRVLSVAGGGSKPVVYAARSDGSVHAYDTANGELLASRRSDGRSVPESLSELGASGRVVLARAAGEAPSTWHWSDPGAAEQGPPSAGKPPEHTALKPEILVIDGRRVLTFTDRSLRDKATTALWQFLDEAAQAAVPTRIATEPRYLLPRLPRSAILHKTAAAAANGGQLVALVFETDFDSLSKQVRIWRAGGDVASPLGRFYAPGSHVPTALSVGTCADAPVVVLGGASGAVQLFDAHRGKPLPVRVPDHSSRVTALALREDASGCLLASASFAGTVTLTDVRTRRSVTADLGEPVVALAVGCDGTVVAATASGLTAVRIGTVARRASGNG